MQIPSVPRIIAASIAVLVLTVLNGCGLFWYLYSEVNDPLERPMVENTGVANTPESFSTLASGNPLSGVLQAVVVTSGEWDSPSAELRLYERMSLNGEWTEILAVAPCRVGGPGMAWGRGLHRHIDDWGPEKEEDDSRAPAGVFQLGKVLGAANASLAEDLGVTMPYEPLARDTACITDVDSFRYNQVVDERFYQGELSSRDWESSVPLTGDAGILSWAVSIGHNMSMPHPNDGSCAFLLPEEASPQLADRGVVFPADELGRLIRALDPGKKPVIVLLPRDIYAMLKPYWTLP